MKSENKREFFNVLRLHRNDIRNLGFIPKLTDEQMADFAGDLGDILLEGGEWDTGIDVISRKYGLKRVKP